MHYQIPMFALALVLTAPLAAQDPPLDAETFFSTRNVSGTSVSHDGTRLLLTSNETGVVNVYAQPLDGGERTPLTRSTAASCYGIGWFPGDDRFLYRADQGGNELDHIYVGHADGSVIDVTPGDNLKAQFGGWLADGSGFSLWTNERDPAVFDLYLCEVAVMEASATPSYPRRILFQNADNYMPGPVSRDGRWVAVSKVLGNDDTRLYLVSLADAGAEPVAVAPEGEIATASAQTFDPGSVLLYYSTDAGSEYQRLWSFDLASRERELVASRDWDVASCSFTRDGEYRVVAWNVDARTELEITRCADGGALGLPTQGALAVEDFETSRDGKTWIVRYAGDASPGDVYATRAGQPGELRPLTRAMPAAIPADLPVAGRVVRYPSFDELEIPAVLYRPKQASADHKVPALVWVHGGPGGQSRVGYRAMLQYLIYRGYAILAVNNRGSSGYGKTFFHLDDRQHGEGDLQDCIHGRRYLEGLEWVDGERVGIVGGSYGGFMVCAAMTSTPDAFEVGIDIFGVTNWLRTLESIPPWWGAMRARLYAELGDPATDRERLQRISPLFHADRIEKPMLVIQGANDPRVLQVESDEMVAAARQNGVPVEYVLFPDEGHGFRQKANEIAASEAIVEFLREHL